MFFTRYGEFFFKRTFGGDFVQSLTAFGENDSNLICQQIKRVGIQIFDKKREINK